MFAGNAGYLFLRFKDGREFLQINPSENINDFIVMTKCGFFDVALYNTCITVQ